MSRDLSMNHEKCEIISADQVLKDQGHLRKFACVDPSAATLLKAPRLYTDALLSAIDTGLADLKRAIERFQHIARHRHLGSPRLMQTLRCVTTAMTTHA